MGVQLKVPARELAKFDNEVLKGDHVIKQLRKAGIPVIGALWPRGAQRGNLTMASNDAGDLTFAYDGEVKEEDLW